MQVKDFRSTLASLPGDPGEYQLFLAEPDDLDGPTVDVALVPVVRVDWDADAKALRLFPELENSNDDALPGPDDLIAAIPAEADGDSDASLEVEVPIVRPESRNYRVSFGNVHDLVIGNSSKEIWLLVRPRSEYRIEDFPE